VGVGEGRRGIMEGLLDIVVICGRTWWGVARRPGAIRARTAVEVFLQARWDNRGEQGLAG
jgi:hypothetical protein